jgi:GAF domain-containing protein
MVSEAVLASLCLRVEALAPGSIAGITLCDESGASIGQGIFPSLSRTFSDAIHDISLAPPFFGSCVQATATGEIVTCTDIATDVRFDPRWRQMCLDHGLRAVQSRPIIVDGRPVGTFVLAWPEPRDETSWDAALMEFGADAAAGKIGANSPASAG